jgi:hypothetical protein
MGQTERTNKGIKEKDFITEMAAILNKEGYNYFANGCNSNGRGGCYLANGCNNNRKDFVTYK